MTTCLELKRVCEQILKEETDYLQTFFLFRDYCQLMKRINIPKLAKFVGASVTIETPPSVISIIPKKILPDTALDIMLSFAYTLKGMSPSEENYKVYEELILKQLFKVHAKIAETLVQCNTIISLAENEEHLRKYFKIPDTYTLKPIDTYIFLAYRHIKETDELLYAEIDVENNLEYFVSVKKYTKAKFPPNILKDVLKEIWPEEYI